ncbi:MAG: hypothetical protein CL678_00640 [Bdellovibrionaceae bacterium]|nr:hypothetical protein [Pseudobdellovibrionaceae bacterium]
MDLPKKRRNASGDDEDDKPPRKRPARSDRKSRQSRGAPKGHHLQSSGDPSRTACMLVRNVGTDATTHISPFHATADGMTKIAALRFALLTFVRNNQWRGKDVKIDCITLVFLAWVWQIGRSDPHRKLKPLQPGAEQRWMALRKHDPTVELVIKHTFGSVARDISKMYNEHVLTFAIEKENYTPHTFRGFAVAVIQKNCDPLFSKYLTSVYKEHPLQYCLGVSCLHSAPCPKGGLHPHKTAEFQRAFENGRLLLCQPMEGTLSGQKQLPTCNPVEPVTSALILKDVFEQQQSRITPEQYMELFVVAHMPKQLTDRTAEVLNIANIAGAVQLLTTSQKKFVGKWLNQCQSEEMLRPLVPCKFENMLLGFAACRVLNRLETGDVRIRMVPALFESVEDLKKQLDLPSSDDSLRKLRWHCAKRKISLPTRHCNVGLVEQAREALTWADLYQCVAAGYKTIYIAVNPETAGQNSVMNCSRLCVNLLQWGANFTKLLCGDAQLAEAPVLCLDTLLKNAIGNCEHELDADRASVIVENLASLQKDIGRFGCLSESTIVTVCAPRAKIATRPLNEAVSMYTMLSQRYSCAETLAKISKGPHKVERAKPKPRGPEPRDHYYDEAEGRYIRNKRP